MRESNEMTWSIKRIQIDVCCLPMAPIYHMETPEMQKGMYGLLCNTLVEAYNVSIIQMIRYTKQNWKKK